MEKVLKQEFFDRPTLTVARELLGCFLCRKAGQKVVRMEITEVEAYDGPYDKASHASRGRTARNSAMFGKAGRWYVYFTYGMHWMLNIVTGPEEYPAAVLIRGTREISGPARLTRALRIDGRLNRKKSLRRSGLWIEKEKSVPENRVRRAPRVGVAYAGAWAKKPYRFLSR